MSLIEVLLAIVIFVVGMLALAQLQTNLTRSSADASMRTVAGDIAEEAMEGMHNYQSISPATGISAYDDIKDKQYTVARGGVDYSVKVNVQDYYFLNDRTNVSTTPPTGAVDSDFKSVGINVSWSSAEFQNGNGGLLSNRLGSGGIAINDIVPALPALGSIKTGEQSTDTNSSPPVAYTPGAPPDYAPIQLDSNTFKESSKPVPEIRRKGDLVETWLDVVTYRKTQTDTSYLRREEFVSISCECTLHAPSGSGSDGRLPTLWTGAEYAAGAKVGKPYGTSASNQQSQYCDVCCRDHHDTGGGTGSYKPSMSSSEFISGGAFDGDHPHYSRDKDGNLTLATNDGDTYLEACRLVRKDGFFRVAQDFDLEAQSVFPENYLNDPSEVSAYSSYVSSAVSDHFENGTTPLVDNSLPYDGRDAQNPSPLPTASGADSQQLRSRGIYVDQVTPALQANIDNCFGAGNRADCGAPQAASVLELYPFFDVQLTYLGRWTVTPADQPVAVTNQELDDTKPYSRGVASLAGTQSGLSTVHSTIETGNVGLISTLPVSSVPSAKYSEKDIYIEANSDSNPAPANNNTVVTGTLTNAGGTSDAAVVSVQGLGASCTKPTNSTFECRIDNPLLNPTPSITVSNYYKQNTGLIACSGQLQTLAFTQGDSASANSTTFALPVGGASGVTITISRSPCPTI